MLPTTFIAVTDEKLQILRRGGKELNKKEYPTK
jgi:hypothetical protein